MARARRRSQAARRGGRRLARGLRWLLTTGLILFLMVYTPLFTLREIKLIGATYLTVDDVMRVGGVYYGEPLFRLETDNITMRLSNDLRVEEVTVRRSLPSTLEIEVVERKPIATIACDYGYLDLDRNGKVIDSYKNLKGMPIPMITGAKVADLYIGDDIDDETLKKILYYLQQMGDEARNNISEVAIVEENYVVAYTDMARAVQIRIGKLERLEEKARLTENFLKDLAVNPHPVEYVDFNYTAPFIKLAQ
ncbi:MAG: FtsQ-type POTRA domain-containing protein [Selenomonadaceae bacterium]|nr:FtsQ-type POTRA domain-containing protein [Selenomonadaceae bacterium]